MSLLVLLILALLLLGYGGLTLSPLLWILVIVLVVLALTRRDMFR